MNRKKICAAMTAAICFSSVLAAMPNMITPTYTSAVVTDSFDVNYDGWYTNFDTDIQAVNGKGFGGSRGMVVTGRTAPGDGAESSKKFYLSGGVDYTYNVSVFSETGDTFHVNLTCIDAETQEESVVELISEEVGANEWVDLSTSYTAPDNATEFLVSITTDSTNDFAFDNFTVTEEKVVGAHAATSEKGLKDEFAGYFRVGNIFNGGTINDNAIKNIILKDCNAIECENETKPQSTINRNGSTDTNVKVSLNSASAIIDFCVKNHLGFRGHTLVWHSQTPEWFFKQNFSDNGAYVSASVMDQRMESYIKNMFNAYSSQYPSLDLYSYDVCNEVIEGDSEVRHTNGTNGQNGSSAWVRIYGNNSFVEKAFTYARKYAPKTCKLYYNDYNEFADKKKAHIINTILKPLQAKGLIDGMGMQSHLDCCTGQWDWGNTTSYLKAMDEYLSLGLDVQVTELDISRNGGQYTDQQQADKYKAIFQHAYDVNKSGKYKGKVTLVQVWGPNDNNSWVGYKDNDRNKPNYPLLYNGNNQPKTAYSAITSIVPQPWGDGSTFTQEPDKPIEPDANGYYFHHTFEGDVNGWETRFCEKVSTSGRTNYEQGGKEALLVEGRTDYWNGAKFNIYSNPFEPGKEFSFSANVSYLDGDETETFALKLQYTGSDNETHYDTIDEGTVSKGDWLQLSNTSYKIPADASDMALYIESAEKEDGAEYNNFYIDDVVGAVKGTVVPGAGKPVVRKLTIGDINFDGKINGYDAIIARRTLLKKFSPDALQAIALDVDQSGTFELADVILINNYILGKITKFPVAEKPVDVQRMEKLFESVNVNTSWKYDGENNPMTTQRFGADPGWLVYNGRLYIYTTNDAYEYMANGKMNENTYNSGTINCVSTADMVNWTDHGAMPIADRNGRTSNGAAKWASAAWAPDACCKTFSDGKTKFYLFFANSGGGIGVVMGDSPTGPWTDPINGALLSHSSPNCGNVEWMFDPGVYYDEKTNECYLFFGGGRKKGVAADSPGTGRVVQVDLKENGVSLIGTPQTMDIPYLFEDSSVIKVGDTWYYSYCSNWDVGNKTLNGVNFGNADILYMKSTDPLKWDRSKLSGNVFRNTGSQNIDKGGNNHHSIIYFKNKYYVAYHSRQQSLRMTAANGYQFYNKNTGELLANNKDGNYRSTQINEATFSNGQFSCSGNMKGCAQIESLDPYTKVQAETMSNQSKGISVSGLRDTTVTGNSGDWIKVSGADLNGVKNITIKGCAKNGGAVKICTGSPTKGTVLGYVELPTGTTSKEVTASAIKSAAGSNDIYLVFSSNDTTLDYWFLS